MMHKIEPLILENIEIPHNVVIVKIDGNHFYGRNVQQNFFLPFIIKDNFVLFNVEEDEVVKNRPYICQCGNDQFTIYRPEQYTTAAVCSNCLISDVIHDG